MCAVVGSGGVGGGTTPSAPISPCPVTPTNPASTCYRELSYVSAAGGTSFAAASVASPVFEAPVSTSGAGSISVVLL